MTGDREMYVEMARAMAESMALPKSDGLATDVDLSEREAAESDLRGLMRDGLYMAFAFYSAAGEAERGRLMRLWREAESSGNPYTVIGMLYGIEESVRELGERLTRSVRENQRKGTI